MPSVAFEVHALDPAELEVIRDKGSDVAGNTLVPFLAEGGEPLRCCLRPAAEGEPLLLFGYERSRRRHPIPASTTAATRRA
jgi:hypothetical protein